MAVGLVFDERFLEHDTGPDHPERPARLRAVEAGLRQAGLWARLTRIDAEPIDLDRVLRVHSDAYVQRLRRACEAGEPFIDAADSAICPASYGVALLAAGGVVRAAQAIVTGDVCRAFCAVRPPGHHCERDRSMGFCLLNNVAIAAETLVREHGLERVAIVDFDVHHGNGTQHIFEDRSDVLFISIHEDPRHLYPGTGFAYETGRGAGEGFTLNVPMPPMADDDAYRRAFETLVLPKLDAFAPQCLLVSAGFDAAGADPLAHIDLTPAAFGWMTEQLRAAADRHCHGRLLSCLEGGYDLSSLAACVCEHVSDLMHSDEQATEQ